jgi:tetratricopeptide (TPR) repeat protein
LDRPQWIDINIARGDVYALLGEHVPAKESYDEALAQLAGQAPSSETLRREARICRCMGELLQDEAPQQAMAWLQRGMAAIAGLQAGSLPAAEEEAALYTRMGYVQLNIGEFDAALAAFDKALNLLPAGPSPLRARILGNLGLIYCSQGHAEPGMEFYREALALSEQFNDYWMMVGMWHNLGIEMEIAGDWPGAIAEYRKAQTWAEEIGSRRHQVELALSLGILFTKQGDDEAAFAQLTRSLELARRAQLNKHLIHILSSLADFHLRTPDVGAALPCLVEAHTLAQELEAEDQMPEIHRLWALARLAQGEPAAALAEAERSVVLARQLSLELEEGMSLRVVGQALHAAGQVEAAIPAFEQSLVKLAERDPYEAARTKVLLGSALHTSGNASRGTELLHEAENTFETLGTQLSNLTTEKVFQTFSNP